MSDYDDEKKQHTQQEIEDVQAQKEDGPVQVQEGVDDGSRGDYGNEQTESNDVQLFSMVKRADLCT
jgi:hypothetical protein